MRILILLFILLSSIFCSAKLNHSFAFINTEKGLSHNTVYSIAQHPSGQMLFGTYDGLNIFDGQQIRYLKHKVGKSTSLAQNCVHKIIIQDDSTIWLQLSNGWISRVVDLTKGIFKNYSFKVETECKLWKKDKRIFYNIKQQVYEYDYKEDRFIESKVKHSVRKEDEYSSSFLTEFLNRNSELYVLDKLSLNRSKVLLATKYNGIVLLQRQPDGTVVHDYIKHDEDQPLSLSKNEVHCLFQDKTGAIWAGTKDGGVNRFIEQSIGVANLSYNQGIPESTIRAITTDTKGRLWVGTYDKGVSIFSDDGRLLNTITHSKKQFQWDRIRSLFCDSKGNIWVGSYGGLSKVDLGGKQSYFTTQPTTLSQGMKRIYCMKEDVLGNLWIGSWYGLYYFNTSTNTFVKKLEAKLSDNNIRNLYLDSVGRLWISTEFGGLNIYDTHKKSLEILTTESFNHTGLLSNSLFEVNEIETNEFWICTSNGVCIYLPDDESLKYFPNAHQLTSQLIYGVTKEDKSKIWLATSKGAVLFNKETGALRLYDREDGWINSNLTEGALFQSKKGLIYFGGNQGVSVVNPVDLYHNPLPPEVNIEIYSQQKKQDFTDKNRILKISETFSIKLSSFHYTATNKNRVAWRLLPKNKEWKLSNCSSAQIDYRDLSTGIYTFEYKGVSSENAWSSPQSVDLMVIAPWWQRPRFLLVTLFCLISGSLVVMRYRYKKANFLSIELEQKVKDRTKKIIDQKRKIKARKTQLQQATKELYRRKKLVELQNEELRFVYEQLKERSQLKTIFFMNVAHEFRTPLTLILGPLEHLIKENGKNEKWDYSLNLIQTQSEYLLSLVNDLLICRNLEPQSANLSNESLEIVGFCKEIIRSFQFESNARNIKLSFTTSRNNIVVETDRECVRRIVVHIISNALKFTPNNGNINFHLDYIQVTESLKLEIKDSGVGIPKNKQSDIFTRYYQIGAKPNPKNKGTGLGLSIVKELIELYGGSISVNSTPYEGSCFIVHLPTSFSSEETKSSIITNDKLIEEPAEISNYSPFLTCKDDTKNSILVIEDHLEMANYMAKLLNEKYNVVIEFNGKKAWERIKKQQFDLILSDYLMPELNGIELCKKVKNDAHLNHIPFILVTAIFEESKELHALNSGVDDIITKPFSSSLILTKIDNLLKRQSALINKELLQNVILSPDKKLIEPQKDIDSRKIAKIIAQNLEKPDFNIQELSSQTGWSKPQLFRKVKLATGFTPNELIQHMRLKQAHQLLSDSDLLVSEVCYRVGFNDPKYFSRCFSKKFSISPSLFKKNSV